MAARAAVERGDGFYKVRRRFTLLFVPEPLIFPLDTLKIHLSLRPDIRVRADTPPTFLLHAEDDHVDDVKQSLAYCLALQKAGVPTDMHLYAQGGHAFGLRPTKLPIGRWPGLVEKWLHTIGVLSPQ